jgi:glycosyltransferase involved in cell wall biosynthesis
MSEQQATQSSDRLSDAQASARAAASDGAAGSVAPPDRVSVIIPTLNEGQTIVRLLEALALQTLQPSEIVVADGGSTDHTRELIREFQTRAPFPVVLVESISGLPGGNRNAGIVRASFEWVACVDAGCVPRADWLERLARAARREPEARVVFGHYEAQAESFFTRCAATAYVPAPHEPLRSTASLLMHRTAFERAGRFREDLRSAEDRLFILALDTAHVRETHAPDATVEWELRPTLSSTFEKFNTYARNNMRAGLAREWQRGVARFYALVVAAFVVGLFFRPLLVVPLLLLLLRGARRVWRWHARDDASRRFARLFNLPRLLVVTLISFVIDLAMFYGTFKWFVHDHVGVPEEEKEAGG